MLDHLFVTHRELVERPGSWEPFYDAFYEALRKLPEEIESAPEKGFTVWEKPALIKIVALSQLEFELRIYTRLSIQELTMMEAVALQRMQDLVRTLLEKRTTRNRTRTLRKARNVLGVMIQQRLTLLFIEMDDRELDKVIALGESTVLDAEQWVQTLTGACSVARAIKAMWRTEWRVHIFLTTLKEDVHLGLDILVTLTRAPGLGIAMGVKTNGRGHAMRTEVIKQEPEENGDEDWKLDRRKIWVGAKELTDSTHRLWIPVRTQVGRPEQRLTLACTRRDRKTVSDLFAQIDGIGRKRRKRKAEARRRASA